MDNSWVMMHIEKEPFGPFQKNMSLLSYIVWYVNEYVPFNAHHTSCLSRHIYISLYVHIYLYIEI